MRIVLSQSFMEGCNLGGSK